MKALMLLAAMAAALPAAANMPAELSSDPLMKHILSKSLQPNGGVTAAVRVKGVEKGIELTLHDPLALPAPAEGLAGKPPGKAAKKRALRRADEQLHAIKAGGEKAAWDKARK